MPFRSRTQWSTSEVRVSQSCGLLSRAVCADSAVFLFHRIVLGKSHNESLRRGRPGCSEVQVLNAKLHFCLFYALCALLPSV